MKNFESPEKPEKAGAFEKLNKIMDNTTIFKDYQNMAKYFLTNGPMTKLLKYWCWDQQ